MKQGLFTIAENAPVNALKTVYRMRLLGDASAVTAPGQFVEAALDGFYLRRPISVCDWDSESLTLIYKIVGGGTEMMSRLSPGSRLDLLTGLGSGYDTNVNAERICLVGGGAGVPPLYALAKALLAAGRKIRVSLGFNTQDEVFYIDEFRRLAGDVRVYTVDGTLGAKGFATDALTDGVDFFFACGPLPMLKAACAKTAAPGQVSLEERMGCGFGACMGCSIMTRSGPRRVCKDGPVFRREELLWDD